MRRHDSSCTAFLISVFSCGDRKPILVHARGKHLVIDIHCHLGIPAADAIVHARYPGPPPGINDFTSAKTAEVNRAQFAQLGRTLNTLDTRLADMDRLGIYVQALSPSPGQYFHFTDPETGRDAARAVNDGMSEYYFNNLIGNPLESTLAVGHLIFGGVLDRHPGLRICVAHGGGYVPGYWGRIDHG